MRVGWRPAFSLPRRLAEGPGRNGRRLTVHQTNLILCPESCIYGPSACAVDKEARIRAQRPMAARDLGTAVPRRRGATTGL